MTVDAGLVNLREHLAREIEEQRARLAEIDEQIAKQFEGRGNQKVTLDDGRIVSRRAKFSDQWDKDELRHAVKDTRLLDKTTGELLEESELEKVLHVFPLGTPRLGAIRDRTLNPDEFKASSFTGWAIKVEGGTK